MSLGTIDGTGLIRSAWMSGIESPLAKQVLASVVDEWVFFGLGSWRGGAAGSPDEPPERDLHSAGKANKSLRRSWFPALPDAAAERPISSFARLQGFVIRSPVANRFRLFLGSSAVEHSTVNRMVAGSNPARGASNFQMLQDCSARFAQAVYASPP